MEPWYKIATPRKEVREGRSFNPDEFAIALEQVVAGKAPEDYRDPQKFFARNVVTRAFKDHAGKVLRRLAGKTENTAPVLSLITQFGGGKTHTLTALYHLATNGGRASTFEGVPELLVSAGLTDVPTAKVAVFVGNSWDPREGRETPWVDVARQLGGDKAVAELGTSSKTSPPGTEALARIFETAGGSVLVLFDEVLNFVNRHQGLAEPFYAFLQNLTVAMTGTTRSAAVVSLPKSKVEMTDSDQQWQERIGKVVRRVAKDLIANDEAEIAQVIRRRLFEDLGSERVRRNVANSFADWCFDRRAQLPPEWTAIDTAATEVKARESLQSKFEACFPFHPSTLSVFQRKWQALPQYQQTRGTLAMLAQWVSVAALDGYKKARTEPLITLGSAPLEVPDFQGVVLGQLGEHRLLAAIEADIAGPHSHARALDVDATGPLKDIHRRVATTIFFESSGGQSQKLAHTPELRFALCEPGIDTTSVDNAASALEARAFFISKVGTDGYQIGYRPTLRKVVNDRRVSLDEEREVVPAVRAAVKKEFDAGAALPIIYFPEDGAAVADTTRLTLVVVGPEREWQNPGQLRSQICEWTRQRGSSSRLYPGSLLWCIRKPGRELKDKAEIWLAWKKVERDLTGGTLGTDFERSDQPGIAAKIREAGDAVRDEVWASYRYLVLSKNGDGLDEIDLGAGHMSGAASLSQRVITTLKSHALLNESPGAGYIERKWPPAFKESGAWPLASLRQAFLTGAMDRLLDPDAYLRTRVPGFVSEGAFGLGSGPRKDGTYDRVWFDEPVSSDEIAFDPGIFLLLKDTAAALKMGDGAPVELTPPVIETAPQPTPPGERSPERQLRTFRLSGTVPPELWNRIGNKLIPMIRSGTGLNLGVSFSFSVGGAGSNNFEAEIERAIEDLGLKDQIRLTVE